MQVVDTEDGPVTLASIDYLAQLCNAKKQEGNNSLNKREHFRDMRTNSGPGLARY